MCYDLQNQGEARDVPQDALSNVCCFDQKYYSLEFCKLNMVRLCDELDNCVLQFRPSFPSDRVFFGCQRMYLTDGSTFIEVFELSDLVD